MGFFDKIKNSIFESEPESNVDVNKPLSPQLDNINAKSKVLADLPTQNVSMNQQVNFFNQQPTMSEEDKAKWMNYFNGKLETAKQNNPAYVEFDETLNTLQAAGLPYNTMLQTSYTLLKKKGITKLTLVTQATNVLQIIKDDQNVYLADKQKRLDEIADMSKQIEDKRKQIDDIQKEINDLNNNIKEKNIKIQTRDMCYSIISKSLTDELQKNVDNINNFVTE